MRWAKGKASLTTRRLYLNKCQELCNYYLGFNSWSVRIVSMDNVEGDGCLEEEVVMFRFVMLVM